MLCGEYAVLDGGTAVVAAIDCYAEARLDRQATASSPFIAAALREAGLLLGELGESLPPGAPVVDTSAFSRDGRKLGLGSSAAATVAAVGAILREAGLELAEPDNLLALHQAARQAHDAAQGVTGSGADILAAVFGGLLVLNDVRLSEREEPLLLPAPLALRLVGTSRSASTAELVSRYRTVGAAAYLGRDRMKVAGRHFVDACRAGAAGEVLAAVEEAYEAFLALGAALGRDLITADHREIAAIAKRLGGVAKPSGAGGGDLAVIFLPDAQAASALPAKLPLPLPLLPYRLSSKGVHGGTTSEKQQP
jgi:mevalonate kinase